MAVEKVFQVTLDLKEPTSSDQFEVAEGDTGNIVKINLTDGEKNVDLSGCLIRVMFSRPDGVTASQSTDTQDGGVSAEGNQITVKLKTGSFSPGKVKCEVQLYSGEDGEILITTARFHFACRKPLAGREALEATDEWPILVETLKRVEDTEEELVVLNEQTQEAAEAANTAADRASMAAENEEARMEAEAERIAAERAREQFLRGITAKAVTLPPDRDATAKANTAGDSLGLDFGIPRGRDGRDAVNVSIDGFFYMKIVDGDLHLVCPENTAPPPLSINGDGDLIYTIE